MRNSGRMRDHYLHDGCADGTNVASKLNRIANIIWRRLLLEIASSLFAHVCARFPTQQHRKNRRSLAPKLHGSLIVGTSDDHALQTVGARAGLRRRLFVALSFVVIMTVSTRLRAYTTHPVVPDFFTENAEKSRKKGGIWE